MTERDDDLANLTGAYVLGALDADEKAAFEAHIAESEQTRNEVTELSDTAVLLGLAVEPEAPPASLKQSIMAQVAVTPQLPAVQTEPMVDAARFGRAETKARSRWFAKPVNALVAVAAAAALIFGGGLAINGINQATWQQAQADQLAAINAAEDSQRQVLPMENGGSATLVWSSQLQSSALMVEGLEPLPADRVYELWYIDTDGARPAGTFTVGESGKNWRVLEGEMAAGDTVGVTVEPAGGSDTPTTPPIIVIESA